MKLLKLLAFGLASMVLATGFSGPVLAEYPTKPVTLIAPYGAGGAADLAARAVSATATPYLGDNVLVVNRTGAAGVTGSTFVAKGRPDGYTLLLSRVGSQAAVPAINRKIPYKWDEFTFLGLLELNPFVLSLSSESPYKTFEELKEAILAGEELSYASAGVGTLLHVAMVIFLDDLGVDPNQLKHIPFKGGGKAAAAVAGGHVDLIFQNLSGVIGNIEGGLLVPVAVTTKERQSGIPDVPTVSELGHPDLEAVIGWSGVWGPKKLPDEVVEKWVAVLQGLSGDETWNKMTSDLGSVPTIMAPDDTKAFVQNQYEKFKEVTERLGMTIK